MIFVFYSLILFNKNEATSIVYYSTQPNTTITYLSPNVCWDANSTYWMKTLVLNTHQLDTHYDLKLRLRCQVWLRDATDPQLPVIDRQLAKNDLRLLTDLRIHPLLMIDSPLLTKYNKLLFSFNKSGRVVEWGVMTLLPKILKIWIFKELCGYVS